MAALEPPRVVCAQGPALAATFVALVLATSPLWAGREAEFSPPPRPAPALFSEDAIGGVLLVRVYASAARDDEFVEVANAGSESVDLTGWSVTDREATATFPLDSILPASGRFLVTRNSTSYAADALTSADFTFDQGEARRMEGGVLRLADNGDEVLLRDPVGVVVDAYAWGDSSYQGPGWTGRPAIRMGRGEIAVREGDARGTWLDRDAAGDWEGLRRYRLGQSTFAPSVIPVDGAMTGILSPDDGDLPLLSFLSSAERSLEVSVYTLTSERIGSVVAAAAHRHVTVRVLLDGAPVGGIEDDEHGIVGGLLFAGVDVRWLVGGSDAVKRYRFLHAKYAIVDARAAWVGSENYGSTGFPHDHKGNRGWSVVVEDAHVATILRTVFEADFDPRRPDSIRAVEATRQPLPPPPSITAWSYRLPGPKRPAHLAIAPDTTLDADGIFDVFRSAQHRLSIEAFYFEDRWGQAPNPFLEAAFEAARRGVSVRILLDGSWASVEAESGTNDDVLARINGRARNESVPLEVRLLEPRGAIQRLHNKGMVADGRVVLVSSMNWALGSATENREVGIIFEDSAVASKFESAFDADWDGRPTAGPDGWRIEDPLLLAGVYAFVGIASGLSLRKLRVMNKDIKPRGSVRTRGPARAPFRGRRGEIRVLSAELVAEPRPRARGRPRARRGREEA